MAGERGVRSTFSYLQQLPLYKGFHHAAARSPIIPSLVSSNPPHDKDSCSNRFLAAVVPTGSQLQGSPFN